MGAVPVEYRNAVENELISLNPSAHHDEIHPRPATGLARKGVARILDVALSTTAVRKAGTLIATANPNIVSANSSMMNLLGCRRSEAVWTGSYRSAWRECVVASWSF